MVSTGGGSHIMEVKGTIPGGITFLAVESNTEERIGDISCKDFFGKYIPVMN